MSDTDATQPRPDDPTLVDATLVDPAEPPAETGQPQTLPPVDLDAPTLPIPGAGSSDDSEPPVSTRAPGVLWQPNGADLPTQPAPHVRQDDALTWPDTCPQCGGVIDAEGYCTQCGARAPLPRDHYGEAPAAWVGGVCDIGRHHRRNEDALALAATPDQAGRAVLVVCDGVTTSQDSDVAALAGARQACRSLWLADPQGLGLESSRAAARVQALRQAVREADHAVVAATAPDSRNPASATIAAAWLLGNDLYSVNLGDSRVYWFPDDGEPVQVSEDHSLAQAQIAEGVSRKSAEASVLAHTITKWLGRDAGEPEPTVAHLMLSEPGWVLACTDGLWNYASAPAALGAVLSQALTEEAGPVAVSERLVAWANAQGGHDNVTVALARHEI
jgi:serine/threonine protein phosphatase PrpC